MDNPTDPFTKLERILEESQNIAASQVVVWQKVHAITLEAYQLVRSFNVEKTIVPSSGDLTVATTEFAQISGQNLVNIASTLHDSKEPTVLAATSKLLLSNLQSNIATFVAEQPQWEAFLPKTKEVLAVQKVPLETRAKQLQEKLKIVSAHSFTMMEGVRQDLLNSTNPLSLSNASKNLREILTALVHEVSPDKQILAWPSVELDDKKRPTRRSRLRYHVFLTIQPGLWPTMWQERVEDIIAEVLDAFGTLNKFTHINEETAPDLPSARIELEKFCDRLLSYLDACDGARDVLADELVESVRERLQDEVDNNLQGELEEEVSHVYAPTVENVEMNIQSIDCNSINFDGSLTIHAQFQIGSDGDVRRGDGLEWEDTRSGTFSGFASKGDFAAITIHEVSLNRHGSQVEDEDEQTDDEENEEDAELDEIPND